MATRARLHLLDHTADLLSRKWALPVVRVLQKDALRYNVIAKALPSVTQRALTLTLRKLERSGIVYRSIYPVIPPQVEYKLTPLGLELLKLSGVLSEWDDTHEEEIRRAQKAYDRRSR